MNIFTFIGQYMPYNTNLVHYLELLDIKYRQSSFVKFLVYFNDIVRHSVFLILADKIDLTAIVKTGLRLRRFFVSWQKRVRKRLYSPLNKTLLSLEPVSSALHFVDIGTPPVYHRLTSSECMNIVQNALLCQQNGFHEPEHPCNPYTKIPFTYQELIMMYLKRVQKNRRIPDVVQMFKAAQFDIALFKKLFHSFLIHEAAKNNTKAMTNSEWNYNLKEILDKFFFTHETCLECLILRHDKHELFDGLMSKYFFDTNQRVPINSNDYANLIHSIFTAHNLYHHNYYHYNTHEHPFFESDVSGINLQALPAETMIPRSPLFPPPEDPPSLVESQHEESDEPIIMRSRRSRSPSPSNEILPSIFHNTLDVED